jgi:hypothetical protein
VPVERSPIENSELAPIVITGGAAIATLIILSKIKPSPNPPPQTSYTSEQLTSRFVAASLDQFSRSKWNADLMRTIEQSQKFFRFQPARDSFATLPIQGEWTSLCDKVSTALWERVIV